jgi:hypothetical protein
MGSGDYGIQSGKKGYKPPYADHEAMCVVKQHGKNPAIGVGPKKVTEGKVKDLNKGGKGKGGGKAPKKGQGY